MPSLSFVISHHMLLQEQQQQQSKKVDEIAPHTNISKVSYIIDPENNLPRTQSALKPMFDHFRKEKGWTGFVGKSPSESQFK
jgi:hypothetical protein